MYKILIYINKHTFAFNKSPGCEAHQNRGFETGAHNVPLRCLDGGIFRSQHYPHSNECIRGNSQSLVNTRMQMGVIALIQVGITFENDHVEFGMESRSA